MTDTATSDSTSFSSDTVQGILYQWWEGLNENRGDRAELRRCRSVDGVLLTEGYHRLRVQLARTGLPFNEGQLGTVAGVLAYVEEDAPGLEELGAHMAGGAREEDALVSGLRFRRLLQRESREDLYRPMIRTVRLLGRRVNVGALARDLFYWGTSVRKRWARTYWENALDEV